MRWTQYFIPTTKETPKDATAASHVLALRAGLIRQLAAGLYTYLPLGYRILRKVEQIVRDEMNRAGAIELHMPVLQPLSIWEETGRTEAMGDVLLRLAGPESDWRSQTVLGPTHEEVITDTARAYLNSYKQLPINLYQIQTKFRGEARPKSGVLRTREFLMKDAYSFHSDKQSLDREYDKMYDAYCRIFGRCGLPYLAVEADSGAIGGDVSHEFMVLTGAGEDEVVLTADRKYAANVERASAAPLPQQTDEMLEVEEVHTPGLGKIEPVVELLGMTADQMIKTLIFDIKALRKSGGKDIEWTGWVMALVRGNHDVNEHKLEKIVREEFDDELILSFEMAGPDSIGDLTNAAVGFAGPQGMLERVDKLIVDRDVATMRNAATGANKTDYHVKNINPGRDFPIEGDKVIVADIRNAGEGDLAPDGSGQSLEMKTAIEIGHIFKLGTKYSTAMNATFLTQQGKPEPLIMGCYGIGVNRLLASAIEAHHDDNGIIWPESIAPFEVLVIALDPRDENAMKTATQVYEELQAKGLDVLFDDRDERAGFKFKDADLVGIPWRVVVGKKALQEGKVEVTRRIDGEKHLYAPGEAVETVAVGVRSALERLNA